MDSTPHPLLEEVLPLMNLGSRDRTIELGCGDGWACRRLAETVTEGLIIGLDASNDQVREARAKSTSFENILYLWSNAEQIPWQEDFFTLALCVNSIDCFEDIKKVLRELFRVLTPGGSIWIVNREQEENCPSRPVRSEPGAAASLLAPDDYLSLLRVSGFEDVAMHTLQYSSPVTPPGIGHLPNHSRAILISARKPADPHPASHGQTTGNQL